MNDSFHFALHSSTNRKMLIYYCSSIYTKFSFENYKYKIPTRARNVLSKDNSHHTIRSTRGNEMIFIRELDDISQDQSLLTYRLEILRILNVDGGHMWANQLQCFAMLPRILNHKRMQASSIRNIHICAPYVLTYRI